MAGFSDMANRLEDIGGFTDYALEFDPSMAYFSAVPQGGSQMQQQYWNNEFGNIWNQFQGATGAAFRAGQEQPTFAGFLRDMPWTERYSSLAPTLRPGSSTRRFSPTTRYMYT